MLNDISDEVAHYLNSEVYEATNVERVLHEVKDELDVLDERQVIRTPQGEAVDLFQHISGHLHTNKMSDIIEEDP